MKNTCFHCSDYGALDQISACDPIRDSTMSMVVEWWRLFPIKTDIWCSLVNLKPIWLVVSPLMLTYSLSWVNGYIVFCFCIF